MFTEQFINLSQDTRGTDEAKSCAILFLHSVVLLRPMKHITYWAYPEWLSPMKLLPIDFLWFLSPFDMDYMLPWYRGIITFTTQVPEYRFRLRCRQRKWFKTYLQVQVWFIWSPICPMNTFLYSRRSLVVHNCYGCNVPPLRRALHDNYKQTATFCWRY